MKRRRRNTCARIRCSSSPAEKGRTIIAVGADFDISALSEALMDHAVMNDYHKGLELSRSWRSCWIVRQSSASPTWASQSAKSGGADPALHRYREDWPPFQFGDIPNA